MQETSNKRMPVMTLPSYDKVDLATRNSAVNLYNGYQAAGLFAMDRVQAWLKQDPVATKKADPFHLNQLEHSLSPFMRDATVDRHATGTTTEEISAFDILRKQSFGAAFHNARSYENLIEDTANVVIGPGATIRRVAVRTKADKTGQRILYPPWTTVRPGLERLAAHTEQYYSWYPGFAALVTMVSLLNLHPLRDGNGRLSRVIFNWMLNGERRDSVYLPISELAILSNHGLLLRIREAQYHNSWKNLSAFFEMSVNTLFSREQ